MIIISDNTEKTFFRNLENELFVTVDGPPKDCIKTHFSFCEEFIFDEIRRDDFYFTLQDKFKRDFPNFCIATSFVDDPIFLFNLKEDTATEYLALMNYPKLANLNFPQKDVGIATVYEIIYVYNTDKQWCVYSNRYYDSVILMYN